MAEGAVGGDEWCVHAQLTITRPGHTFTSTHRVPVPAPSSQTETTLAFDYSWQREGFEVATPSRVIPFASGIQKFESWSPRRGGTEPPAKPCKSTCSITLAQPIPTGTSSSGRAWSEERVTCLRDAETQTSNCRESRSRSFSTVLNGPVSQDTVKTPKSILRQRSRSKSSPPNECPSRNKNEPRTIHIDVYCTGSEVSSPTDDSSSQSSTSQTVFESPNYKIRHQSKKQIHPPLHAAPSALSQDPPPPHRLSTNDKVQLLTQLIQTEVERSGIFRPPPSGGSSGMGSDYPSSSIGNLSRELTQSSLTSNASSLWAWNPTFPLQRGGTWRRGLKEESPSPSQDLSLSGGEEGLEMRPVGGYSGNQWWADYVFPKSGPEEQGSEPISVSSLGSIEVPRRVKEIEAGKFGQVLKGLKKPGHHIPGPPKNPHCPCQTCRLHFR